MNEQNLHSLSTPLLQTCEYQGLIRLLNHLEHCFDQFEAVIVVITRKYLLPLFCISLYSIIRNTTFIAMKQWLTSQDGLENLNLTTTDPPQPKEGEVLVKINAVSLNYRDTEGMCRVINALDCNR